LLWTLAGFAARGFFEDSSPERKIVPLEHPVYKPGISRNPTEENGQEHRAYNPRRKHETKDRLDCSMSDAKKPGTNAGFAKRVAKAGGRFHKDPR
jgi:hypothetical protein